MRLVNLIVMVERVADLVGVWRQSDEGAIDRFCMMSLERWMVSRP